MHSTTWEDCLHLLQANISQQQFNTWIRPLKAEINGSGNAELHLFAPNRFILDWVNEKFLTLIQDAYSHGKVILDISPDAHNGAGLFSRSMGDTVASPASVIVEQTELLNISPEDQSKKNEISQPVNDNSSESLNDVSIDSAEEVSKHLTDSIKPDLSQAQSLFDRSSDQTNNFSFTDDNIDDSQVQQIDSIPLDSQPSTIIEKNNSVTDNIALTSSSPKKTLCTSPNVANISSQPRSPRFASSDTNTTQSPKIAAGAIDKPLKSSNAVKGSNSHEQQGVVIGLNDQFTFSNFVEGKSNQLALAAAKQVADNPGGGYNPLFLYGGVGLGKTHLMHAVGNTIRRDNPTAKIVYLHSERFVADMVKALQLNAISDFKRYYRSCDALLIDDIQFFANKDRSQEEFFHTFNSLMESGQQMIFTCDRYPKEIDGLEERLKSRFGWGLTVAVEPPELETRVAILMQKAQQANIQLPQEEAFFIAQRIRSNVRELEGALKRVVASSQFTGLPISIELIKDSLKDLISLQERSVTIDNIQKVVAEYFKIRLADLLSKKRTRSLARPRQVAMYLAKELTSHSLPEIGTAFGGRDHTTVIHACRKIKELADSSESMSEDLKNLLRTLSH